MLIALPWLRRLTATLSIALVVVGALVSGHAQASHLNGLSAASTAPCHHALDNGAHATTANSFALDLCRQLCLNKMPDTAIAAAHTQHPTPIQTSAPVMAYAVIPASAGFSVVAFGAQAPSAVDRLRRAHYPTTQRLLI